MSKRLQVVLDDEELQEIRRTAKRERMSVAAWVRQALREARRLEPEREAHEKLDAIRRAAEHDFPTGEIDQTSIERRTCF
jgi:hypothetical protein